MPVSEDVMWTDDFAEGNDKNKGRRSCARDAMTYIISRSITFESSINFKVNHLTNTFKMVQNIGAPTSKCLRLVIQYHFFNI